MPDNTPGISAIIESEERQIWAAGPDNNHKRYQQKIHIKSTVVDAGNSGFTTTIRAGNAIGRKDSDSLDYLYSPSAVDGTQGCIGLLEHTVPMVGRDGVVADRFTHMLTSGIIRNIDDLLGVDKQALATLLRTGFTIAQPVPHGSAFLLQPWRVDFQAANYTVLDADHGKMIVATTGAVTFTMPSLATVGPGFEVLLFNSVAATMTVTAAVDTIVFGDAAGGLSTSLAFSTANKQMGGQVLMKSGYDGGGTPALRWFPLFPVNATSA